MLTHPNGITLPYPAHFMLPDNRREWWLSLIFAKTCSDIQCQWNISQQAVNMLCLLLINEIRSGRRFSQTELWS